MKRPLIMALLMFMALCFACAKRSASSANDKSLGSKIGLATIQALDVERVYFPFDSAELIPEASDGIRKNATWLNKNDEAYVILEGHCDDVGQSEYNVELGDRRARAVKAAMMEKGVPSERIIMVVSYGSLKPLNPGHRIEDLRENRRVEFVVR